MNKYLEEIIDESIKLELNVAALYDIFSQVCAEDYDFWVELLFEEKRHAALLEEGKKTLLPDGFFPEDMLSSSLEEVKKANFDITKMIEKYKKKPPPREEAFKVALLVEESAGEFHFQKAMEGPTSSDFLGIFQAVGKDDVEHFRRIWEYMRDNLKIQPSHNKLSRK